MIDWEPIPCGHCRTVMPDPECVGLIGYGAWCRDCSAQYSELTQVLVDGFRAGHDVSVTVTRRHRPS